MIREMNRLLSVLVLTVGVFLLWPAQARGGA